MLLIACDINYKICLNRNVFYDRFLEKRCTFTVDLSDIIFHIGHRLLTDAGYSKNHFIHFVKNDDNLYYRHLLRGEDLIAMGIDGKHSFEDKIRPVEEVFQQYGDRVAILGGVDMDIMAAGSEDAVRKRTREILDACGGSGRYVLGTGNSAANYIPLRNYLAMIDEGLRWNQAHFPGGR